jgi:hypothetical protein
MKFELDPSTRDFVYTLLGIGGVAFAVKLAPVVYAWAIRTWHTGCIFREREGCGFFLTLRSESQELIETWADPDCDYYLP